MSGDAVPRYATRTTGGIFFANAIGCMSGLWRVAVIVTRGADKGTQGRGRTNVVTQNSDNVHKVVNCYLEGSAQGVMVGGGGGHEPAYDIEVRRNYFFKPWQWNPSHPDFAGIKWATKSHLECKNCVRLLAEANVFEQVWGGFGGSCE